MITLERGASHKEIEPRPERELLIVGHTYQPPRDVLKPFTGDRIKIVPEVNEQIYTECYKPIFVDSPKLPDAVFSLYPTLREWIKSNHPQDFQEIKQKLRTQPDREYKVLGDPYIHAILPLIDKNDQDTLVKIGKEAFFEDFGFYSKGFWLPEAGVTTETLDVLRQNDYEFVVLRDSQLESAQNNPMYVPTEHGDIAVFHFESGLSGRVSFEDRATANGDDFLEDIKSHGRIASIGTDTERYGHHEPKGKDKFLLYVADSGTLNRHGFSAFNIKEKMDNPNREYTRVKERSSWSCDHSLGRWTGENCNCWHPSEERNNEKRWMFQTLKNYGKQIDEIINLDPLGKERFIPFFLDLREAMFNGSSLKGNENPIYIAKAAYLVAMTSCGWFFPENDRIEAKTTKEMVPEIEKLIAKINFPSTRAA